MRVFIHILAEIVRDFIIITFFFLKRKPHDYKKNWESSQVQKLFVNLEIVISQTRGYNSKVLVIRRHEIRRRLKPTTTTTITATDK